MTIGCSASIRIHVFHLHDAANVLIWQSFQSSSSPLSKDKTSVYTTINSDIEVR